MFICFTFMNVFIIIIIIIINSRFSSFWTKKKKKKVLEKKIILKERNIMGLKVGLNNSADVTSPVH